MRYFLITFSIIFVLGCVPYLGERGEGGRPLVIEFLGIKRGHNYIAHDK